MNEMKIDRKNVQQIGKEFLGCQSHKLKQCQKLTVANKKARFNENGYS